MPIYEYKCKSCEAEFEELMATGDESTIVACKTCGADAERVMSRFSSVITGGSENEPVDVSIGREAEKRWQMHNNVQNERRKGMELKSIDLPKAQDGKFMPVMGLGDKVQQEKRQEYSSALQEHRQDRAKKGLPQFSDAGSF